MEKALLMVLFPFFTVILLIGFAVYQSRGGRPLKVKLRGFGVSFELNSEEKAIAKENHESR